MDMELIKWNYTDIFNKTETKLLCRWYDINLYRLIMEGKGKSTEAEEDQRGHGRRMWRGDGR